MTPTSPILKLSVVIPAYNERRCIQAAIRQVRDYAHQRHFALEIIVVDDASTDATPDLVRATDPESAEVRLLINPRNRGKGYSVRRGILHATGDVVLMSDADMSTPIDQLDRLLPFIDEGFAVVIASRAMPDSVLDPPQPLFRRLLGFAFAVVRRAIILPQIRDTQCGFKLFVRSAAHQIFQLQTAEGFAFDSEALRLAELLGYRVKEVGVLWRNDPHSSVRPFRDSIRIMTSLLRIRFRLARLKLEPQTVSK